MPTRRTTENMDPRGIWCWVSTTPNLCTSSPLVNSFCRNHCCISPHSPTPDTEKKVRGQEGLRMCRESGVQKYSSGRWRNGTGSFIISVCVGWAEEGEPAEVWGNLLANVWSIQVRLGEGTQTSYHFAIILIPFSKPDLLNWGGGEENVVQLLLPESFTFKKDFG